MVFALEHHYTQRGLSLDLLKGADRQLADLIVSAAEQKDCLVHLAQISRHLMQFADDGSFGEGYSRYYRAPRRKIEIGETYEDELIGTEWADSAGKKQPWGNIPFDLSTIVSSVPIDDWKPTKEEFEGYTGNAGNTLDRWYHRSALVVWHRDCHFEIVASSGAVDSIPLFCSMAAKLAKKPKKHFEAARIDCIRFARAIISRWPRSINSPGREKSFLEYFPEHLQDLHDRDTVALFLSKLAEQDQSVGLSSFILTACREFGWSTFSRELKQLILSRRETYGGQEIPLRDIEWLSAFSCDKSVDPDRSVLAKELCGLAVARFCEPAARRPAYHWSHQHRESSVSEKSVPLLLKGIVASGRNEDLSKVIQFVQGSPDEFRIDNCLVPCLKSLVPWSQRQFGSVHPQLMAWLSAVRQQLESATATEPTPPVDWTRPAKVVCDCQYCAQLNLFLADESNGVARIPAREEMRGHLLDMINRHQCDVKHTLDRRGSPHALVLTKTTGSFERAVKRFEANCRLLSELPGVE